MELWVGGFKGGGWGVGWRGVLTSKLTHACTHCSGLVFWCPVSAPARHTSRSVGRGPPVAMEHTMMTGAEKAT